MFGSVDAPCTSYGLDEETASVIRNGEIVSLNGMSFASIDMVVNTVKMTDILPCLNRLLTRESIRVMIHEQYFYEDYPAYQPDFEEKLETVLKCLCDNGYQSRFFEELL